MESCVIKVMKEGKTKESAIAICKSSIMEAARSNKLDSLDELSINTTKGGEIIMEIEKKEKVNVEDSENKEVKATDEKETEEQKKARKAKEAKKAMSAKEKAAEDKEEAKEPKSQEDAEKAKKADEIVDVAKVEEESEVVEAVETPEVEKAEEVEPAVETPEIKPLDPIEVLKSVSVMEDPALIKKAIETALSQLTKKDEEGKVMQAEEVTVDVTKMLNALSRKLDYIESLVKVDEPAKVVEPIVEPAKVEEVKPIDEEAKEPEVVTEVKEDEVAETKVSEEAPAKAEEIKDTEVIAETPTETMNKLDGFNETLSKMNGEFMDMKKSMEALTAEVEKIAKSPVASKVASPAYVVEKAFEVTPESTGRIAEIKEELSKLDDIRKNDLGKYQSDRLGEKAYDLIKERDRLTASN